MTHEELILLVAEMRAWQRIYFRSRTPESLDKAKDLERRVDEQVAKIQDRQGRLFT